MTFADTHPLTQTRKRLTTAFKSPVTGSVLLIVATVAALVWANSPWYHSYFHLWETPTRLQVGDFAFSLTLHQWINDGLMVLFFLSVGLEIKREVLAGKLSSPRKAMLPIMAALGGMLVPAMVYLLFNLGGPGAVGWGVPMATDIAFAIGILLLLGKRVPLSLKVFITALAIIDDIGAVLVIAVFYSEQIIMGWLVVAFGFLAAIFVFTRLNVRHTGVYMLLTAGVWLGVMLSGIHATLAGILAAIMVPARARINPSHFIHLEYYHLRRLRHAEMTETSVLTDEIQIESIIAVEEAARDMEPVLVWLEHKLLPYVTFIVIPLFALSNAGIHLAGDWQGLLSNPVTLGVVFGLIVGKQVGVTLFTWLAVRLRLADMPTGVTWPQVYAMSWLTSIGFTMSLFITELAFTEAAMIDQAKLGILLASILAAGIGYTLLRVLLPKPDEAPQSATGNVFPVNEPA